MSPGGRGGGIIRLCSWKISLRGGFGRGGVTRSAFEVDLFIVVVCECVGA